LRSSAAILVAIAAGGSATAGGERAIPTAHAAARTRSTSQLRISLFRSLVAAGNVGGYISFANRSPTACRLTGWPKLVALHRSRRGDHGSARSRHNVRA
jgi:hypothetical protein